MTFLLNPLLLRCHTAPESIIGPAPLVEYDCTFPLREFCEVLESHDPRSKHFSIPTTRKYLPFFRSRAVFPADSGRMIRARGGVLGC